MKTWLLEDKYKMRIQIRECCLTAVWSSGRSQVIFTYCFFINNRWATISSYMSLPFLQKQKDEVEYWGEKKVRETFMSENNWTSFLNYIYINKVRELAMSSFFFLILDEYMNKFFDWKDPWLESSLARKFWIKNF